MRTTILRSGAACLVAVALIQCNTRRSRSGFESRRNVAVAALADHLPSGVGHNPADTMVMWAITASGLSERRHVRGSGWLDWRHHNRPPNAVPTAQWDLGLPMTSGWKTVGPAVYGGFAFPESAGASMVAVPFLDGFRYPPSNFHYDAQQAPTGTHAPALREHVNPETVVMDWDNIDFHLFGTADSDKTPTRAISLPLLRLQGSWDITRALTPSGAGLQLTFTNHGQPTSGGLGQGNVIVSRNSACSMPMRRRDQQTRQFRRELHHFCFVKADYGTEDRVTYLHFDGTAFQWGADLGSPQQGEIVGGPMAYAFETPSGFYKMSVFIVMYDREESKHKLYERQLTDRNNSQPLSTYWGPWRDAGPPLDKNGQPALLGSTKFRMTAPCIWHDGESLRINIFGWANGESGTPRTQLLHYYWNGGQWGWADVVPPSQFKNGGTRRLESGDIEILGVKTDDAAVVDKNDYVRLAVFARTPAGSIFEYAWEWENGRSIGWRWSDLSWEPVRLQRGPAGPFP